NPTLATPHQFHIYFYFLKIKRRKAILTTCAMNYDNAAALNLCKIRLLPAPQDHSIETTSLYNLTHCTCSCDGGNQLWQP
ncbi:MAG: hypothetical protein AAFR56_11720, partial [Chloroflexota bacterium]